MENGQMEVFKGSELSLDELQAVTGGSTTGAALALGGTLLGIGAAAVGGIVGGGVIVGVAAVLGMGAAAFGGLSYAYDAYSSAGGSGNSF